MAKAVENYSRYRRSPEAWMLGKFVVPASRLNELEANSTEAFPLSVLSDPESPAEVESISRSRTCIDTMEIKAADSHQIESAMGLLSREITTYFEISDPALIAAIANTRARAKIRTGGVTPNAFPSAGFIADFLVACASSRVAFKATAGLHHALRCFRPLTYAPDSPSGWMFGFLNVFIAAALAWKGATAAQLEYILLEESLVDHRLTEAEMRDARSNFAISFGSCSFEEPVADLKALGIV